MFQGSETQLPDQKSWIGVARFVMEESLHRSDVNGSCFLDIFRANIQKSNATMFRDLISVISSPTH